MATTPEEFFAAGLMVPPPPSPSLFLDLPPMLDDGEGHRPLSPGDPALYHIQRVLMEEDTTGDDSLSWRQDFDDHHALLQVQQPFAQILSGAAEHEDRMFREMMLHGPEILVAGMQKLSLSMAAESKSKKRTRRRRGLATGNGKGAAAAEAVDLRMLLVHCAQAVAGNNHRAARELLAQIKRHAPATGDGTQRLAHCFAGALEARLAGGGGQLWRRAMADRPPPADCIAAYSLLAAASCFVRVVNAHYAAAVAGAMASAGGRTKVHIVDYGSCYGFHLAGLLRELAGREGGPPREVRVTVVARPGGGGLRSCPAERAEDTGARLAACAREFGLPSFALRAVTGRPAEAVRAADLGIADGGDDDDEALVVNDLFGFSTLMDDSVFVGDDDEQPCPRDAVLGNVREMLRRRRGVFVQSVVNYSCGTSFLSRFQGALFYYGAMFDMLDATVPRGDERRAVLEQAFLGRDAQNAIACEGAGLVDRPETYRQWQVRNRRAGLRQLPLRPLVVEGLKEEARTHHHKDLLISEDEQWLLQGWRGRVLFAHSTWVADEDDGRLG